MLDESQLRERRAGLLDWAEPIPRGGAVIKREQSYHTCKEIRLVVRQNATHHSIDIATMDFVYAYHELHTLVGGPKKKIWRQQAQKPLNVTMDLIDNLL
jgi:hypothetical protein